MKTNSTKRRGFTIVELVIVIAVIGILSAVLIPTFTSIIKKANVSADVVTVKNMNTVLKANETLYGKPTTYSEMLEVAEAGGYKIENLTPSTNNYEILWDRASNTLYLYDDEGNLVKNQASAPETTDNLWKVVKNVTEV